MSSAQTQPRWILSFADLLSVILTFFVLIYSMSIPPDHNELNRSGETDFSLKSSPPPLDAKLARTDEDLATSYLYQVITEKAKRDKDLSALKYSLAGEDIVISLNANEFTPVYERKLASFLKTIENDIRIYTGNLTFSHNVAVKLRKSGLNKNITYLENPELDSKIDIIIYP